MEDLWTVHTQVHEESNSKNVQAFHDSSPILESQQGLWSIVPMVLWLDKGSSASQHINLKGWEFISSY